mmetsp:Transcript_17289/g.37868  ORF Transcript_17289/g.37868 Transcript_17289/m.37868 type:complete len:276 (+) Transcript_17289:228-1055(+)|eukprot:CAMPEP_0168166208 /NCGR_PEP_ID=MMETSP0139_2-20121125/1900_1 /TAXON_ID=44445 /ORGANISM="Pseudo-nitzschia australis, Strain 10249 10 AB" /LENGTH=275 /DNA_ID=CAMNT_0008083381 /DNA_START=187 /DNA_END=1014 /DNA_ORIENTATION=-
MGSEFILFCFTITIVLGISSGLIVQPEKKCFDVTPSAIIFDIDGTLADSWKLGFDATLVVLENNQLPLIDEATYHDGTKYSTPQRLARHAGLEPIIPAKDEEALAKNLVFEQTGEKLGAEFDNLYVDLVTTETAGLFPGIQRILEKIISCPSSVRVGCLTNACVAYAHAVLKANNDFNQKFDLVGMCQSVHGADTVAAPKPKPDGLYKVCNELGIRPCDSVYIGDSPSDALAADAAGMPSIGVTWGSHSEESLRNAPFTFYASTPDELGRLLNLS